MLTIRLLVVEDNEAFQYLIRHAFEHFKHDKFKWEVTLVSSGEEALKILFAEEAGAAPLPEIILLDWNLPHMSGQEVLTQIKEHQYLRGIPVLIFSSSDADQDVHAAFHGHANAFIKKPAGMDALKITVETVSQFWITLANRPKISRGGKLPD